MKKLLLLLFCLSECARCPGSDFEKIRVNGVDKCVKPFIYDISNPIFNRPRTWSDSEKECQRVAPAGKDGHLVSIHSEEELQSIRNLLGSAETGKQFWIGLRMNCPTCGFTWSDHTPVDFEIWRDGEPNNVGGVVWG
ncbi:Oidioi.mRNA.OKI2018_I69.PAR.g12230.t1.cds [Oikopleura dioica]|uniref:Oidioi.mRNA.OKI2018_I69.PAR.g12230.t1.cds n=1 Tax=Oikopleura dioica TaxID=34765 RepID=A0ABN7S5G9_OIKDI|nr:Oidioi.mRNA.OKI2018_I69.PAR.g12230.t1.cds [Oikopleura dioica]